MSTIQDVAKLANVSAATVSRVINKSSSVTEETRKIVQKAIDEMNYQPNLLGRNLRRTETSMVLVLVPNIANPFYSRIVKGIEDVSHSNGYNIMLCNTNSDSGREKVYLELLKNKLSDGIIFMATELNNDELSDIGAKFPVVQCCEYKEGVGVSLVSIDNYSASCKAVKHLLSLGHRKIGMISAQNRFLSTIQREAGYKSTLQNAGIAYRKDFLKYGDYSFKSGLRLANQLISMEDRPTAIFAISDIMAIGAMRAVKEKGLRVPEDVAVSGFDNISFAAMCDPPLTTISQPKYDIGRAAMELLLKQIRHEIKDVQNILLEYELVIRESTVK
jgi:LacI family transcriptional regulator, repressor for deo operon, udp, cdd, tsx, nupC, and nupG